MSSALKDEYKFGTRRKDNSLGRGSRTVYAKEENDESAWVFWGIFLNHYSLTYHKFFLAKARKPLSHHYHLLAASQINLQLPIFGLCQRAELGPTV